MWSIATEPRSHVLYLLAASALYAWRSAGGCGAGPLRSRASRVSTITEPCAVTVCGTRCSADAAAPPSNDQTVADEMLPLSTVDLGLRRRSGSALASGGGSP